VPEVRAHFASFVAEGRNMKKLLAFGCLLAIAGTVPSSTVYSQQNNPAIEAFPGEILVQFQPGASAADKNDARGWVGAAQKRALKSNHGGEMEILTVKGRSVEDAIQVLKSHPAIKLAEPNFRFTHALTANDPEYTNGSLWGMYSDDVGGPFGPPGTTNQFGSQAEKAWGAGFVGSDNVYVGVIDEGVDFNHPDLTTNMWVNPFDPINGVDDDHNGFIDDRRGWDFFHHDNSVFDPADGDEHGTHVSGTIGAQGNNGIGVVGVNWNVTIIPIKFLGPGGGDLGDAVDAIDYLTDLKTRHNLNIVASSNSWGCLACFSQALEDAIVRGAQQGILFVAAAGNNANNNDTTPFYPASHSTLAGAGYEAVISVAAIDDLGSKAGFSNFGTTSVDLGAPGVFTLSTTPGNTYSFFSGTSMATPHVTGAIALLKSVDGTLTANQLRTRVLTSTTPTPSLAGITVTGGRLNIGNMLIPPKPDLVTKKIVVPASAKAGNTINLTQKTKNIGGANAPPSVTFIYFSNNATLDPGDPLVGQRNVPLLAPGTANKGTVQVTIPTGTPTGTRYFFVKSDGPGTVAESNENNNVKQKSIQIVP
jgi:subtilisin family serine protease